MKFQRLQVFGLITIFLFNSMGLSIAQADGFSVGDAGPGPAPRVSPTSVPPGQAPRPRPTTTTSPTPTPTATATPEPSPTFSMDPVVDIEGARRLGVQDGMEDGQREGMVRGPQEGDQRGREEGFREGYGRCEREEKERFFERGYREGFLDGERDGAHAGRTIGERDGAARGIEKGERDGLNRANEDAEAAATGPGTAQGIEEANRSDATERGRADGTVAGDRDAIEKARREDYARGRSDLRSERFAEGVAVEEAYNQKQPVAIRALNQVLEKKQGSLANLVSRIKNAVLGNAALSHIEQVGDVRFTALTHPDRRFYQPRRTYPTTDENTAYGGGYEQGYNEGFSRTYDFQFRQAYDPGFRHAQADGCRRARGMDYRADYRRGWDQGRTEGYDRAYRVNYDSAYSEMYQRKFREVSDETYSANYNRFYQSHFEAARSAAYRQRVSQLYDAAFARAHDAKFQEVYPKYAEQEYRRGRADETEDFRLRPVRMLGVEIVETISNGVLEPGELLRVKIKLRNFSDRGITAKDVRVQLAAVGGNDVAVISQSDVLLARDLKAKSITTISEVVEFRMTENVAGELSKLQLKVSFQGRTAGDKTLEVLPQFMISTGLASVPELHEGMEGEIRIRVKNISTASSDGSLKLRLSSGNDAIEITRGEAEIGALSAGEEKILSFGAIARKGGKPEVTLALDVTEGTGRRVGLMDETREIPVINDYTIGIVKDLQGLREAGVFRAEYVMKNVNSRKILKSLQLFVKIQTQEEGAIVVMGPNPQFLTPLMNGQSKKFVVPLLVKNSSSASSGGTVELEVKEAGRTVVIHRAEF